MFFWGATQSALRGYFLQAWEGHMGCCGLKSGLLRARKTHCATTLVPYSSCRMFSPPYLYSTLYLLIYIATNFKGLGINNFLLIYKLFKWHIQVPMSPSSMVVFANVPTLYCCIIILAIYCWFIKFHLIPLFQALEMQQRINRMMMLSGTITSVQDRRKRRCRPERYFRDRAGWRAEELWYRQEFGKQETHRRTASLRR